MEAMSRLEQQVSKILNVMYNSVTKQNFNRVSDDVDRVLGAVDSDSDKIDTDSIKIPYDNVNDIITGTTKYEQNTTSISKDTHAKYIVPHDRHDNTMTKVKWSTETNDIDNRFLREYDNMCKLTADRQTTDYDNRFLREYDNMRKLIKDRQATDYYAAQRHIQSTMMSDTPVKTVQNRQYIDNVSDYDSEHYRISKSVHHKLDLGPSSLLEAQQHTTVETAAAIERQDNKKGKFKAHIQSEKGQYRIKIHKRAESMIPQLDGTYNVSDSSNTDSHDYLDLASTNIIQYRTRRQKQRQKANEMADANRHSAHIEYIKPNKRIRMKRQKVPDDEDIDIDKTVKDDTPRHDRKRATEIERQSKEKEARRLELEKAK